MAKAWSGHSSPFRGKRLAGLVIILILFAIAGYLLLEIAANFVSFDPSRKNDGVVHSAAIAGVEMAIPNPPGCIRIVAPAGSFPALQDRMVFLRNFNRMEKFIFAGLSEVPDFSGVPMDAAAFGAFREAVVSLTSGAGARENGGVGARLSETGLSHAMRGHSVTEKADGHVALSSGGRRIYDGKEYDMAGVDCYMTVKGRLVRLYAESYAAPGAVKEDAAALIDQWREAVLAANR